MVPLRAHLRNGDIVEIVTSPGHKPSRDWLNFVVTSHARYKIKHLIRLEERTRAVDVGRKVFEKEARKYDVSPKGIQLTEAFGKAQAEAGAKTPEDLFALIGYGTLSAKQLLGRLVPSDKLRERPPESMVSSVVRRAFGGGEEKIKVTGSDDVLVFRARCCNPIRGEKIVGYITRGKGVSVHSATCPNVLNLLYDPERRIAVEWDEGGKGESTVSYTVKLEMEVEDRKGVLAAVSAKIAAINTNIKNMEARAAGEDQRARIDVTVEISDLKHLEKVIKSLRGVSGVLDVSRAAGAGRIGG
jgi:GTP pyrophosphokinase